MRLNALRSADGSQSRTKFGITTYKHKKSEKNPRSFLLKHRNFRTLSKRQSNFGGQAGFSLSNTPCLWLQLKKKRLKSLFFYTSGMEECVRFSSGTGSSLDLSIGFPANKSLISSPVKVSYSIKASANFSQSSRCSVKIFLAFS